MLEKERRRARSDLWARRISALGLTTPALVALDVAQPLARLLESGVVALRPFLEAVAGARVAEELAAMASPEGVTAIHEALAQCAVHEDRA